MRIFKILTLLLLISASAFAQSTFILLKTENSEMLIKLYDQTPKHRDNLILGIQKGWWNNALFNRVIKDFVSQAGELDEPILAREKANPEQKPQRIAAEINPELYHFKGTLAAGRDDNPEKASYLNQIYLVAGKVQTDAQLDAIEEKKGFKYTAEQRKTYKTLGGLPRLDGDYTVIGEIVKGLQLAKQINQVQTNKADLPLEPVTFSLKIINQAEAAKLLSQ